MGYFFSIHCEYDNAIVANTECFYGAYLLKRVVFKQQRECFEKYDFNGNLFEYRFQKLNG